MQTFVPPRRQNLPLPPTPLVGRERDLAAVRRRLPPRGAGPASRGADPPPAVAQLLTLTGPPGIGKTRLALAAADGLAGAFADGVWLVELAPLADPALVPQAVATAVGVQEAPEQPLLATLTASLRPRRLLLLLDNCEHLVRACAELVDALLRACPRLTVLATSREALGIAAEHTWPVPPLALPPPGAGGPGRPAAEEQAPLSPDRLTQLMRFEAVRLFVARAAAGAPGFAVTEANAPAVAEVCRRLDGIPLALELAAARVRALSVAQLAARLGDRFGLLTAGSRTALARHQTLRAAVDWSYDLLPGDEQRLFARLSVFAGGFTLEAAEAVAGAVPAGERAGPVAPGAARRAPAPGVLDGLARLVDKSLVLAEVHDEADGDGARYRLLETLRQYAAERLAAREAPGGAAAVREGHARHYLALAEASRVPLLRAEQLAWLARLDREHDNLRAALRWWLERGRAGDGGAAERGLRLAGALGWPYWSLRAHHTEAHEWLGALLALRPARPTLGRARALLALGQLSFSSPDWRSLTAWFEESAATGRALGDTWTAAYALASLGIVTGRGDATAGGGPAAARARFEEALGLFRELGDRQGVAYCLRFIGLLHHRGGDLDAALGAYTSSLDAARAAGERWVMSVVLCGLGELALARGDVARARTHVGQGLALTRELGLARGTGVTLLALAEVEEAASAPREALGRCREAAAFLRPYNLPSYNASLLVRCATAHLALGDHERAVRLAGAAASLSEAAVDRLRDDVQSKVEHVRAAGRQALGGPASAAAWARGCALTAAEALDDGLAAAPAPEPVTTVAARGERRPHTEGASAAATSCRPAAQREGERLSARERQVAVLVARGYSNPQIATALTVTRATAARHVEHILAKLSLHSRAQVAAWAAEHGLLAADPE